MHCRKFENTKYTIPNMFGFLLRKLTFRRCILVIDPNDISALALSLSFRDEDNILDMIHAMLGIHPLLMKLPYDWPRRIADSLLYILMIRYFFF